MEKTRFDQVIDRKNTNSLKFDFAVERGLPEDVLPLWVADMDFKVADPIQKALRDRVEHGIFGYSDNKESYYEAVKDWFKNHYGYESESEWIVKTPGVVTALAMAVKAFTKEGDAVLIQTPVYYPFYGVIEGNGRKLVENPLIYQDGRYEIDFDDFENKIEDQDVKMMILCNPHNPVGRVFTEEELKKMGKILKDHDVILVSDEIHCDFAFPGHPHRVFTEAVPQMRDHAIICTAPSKSFNLAGLQTSNIFIENKDLRRAFEHEMLRSGLSQLNTFGLVACETAYRDGEEWLDAVRDYMRGNLDYLRDFVDENLPGVKLIEPEGTYFAWLDFNGTGLSDEELNEMIVQDAKLWLDAGNIFGGAGRGFERFVLACPRATLEEAMRRLQGAFKKRGLV